MRLLLDANISRTLVAQIFDMFEDSSHVALVGLERATDEQIWDFALRGDYVIVSKDEDFHQKALVVGPPPKVIWIRLGNCSTGDIERAIRRGRESIMAFADDGAASFLALE